MRLTKQDLINKISEINNIIILHNMNTDIKWDYSENNGIYSLIANRINKGTYKICEGTLKECFLAINAINLYIQCELD